MIIAYTPPINAVINCVTENWSCNACIIGCIFSGSIFGRMIRDIRIPINKALSAAPIAIDIGSPAVLPHFLRRSPTAAARMIFPIMIHGNIAGMAAIIGLPVIKNEVIGVITLKIMPQARPA